MATSGSKSIAATSHNTLKFSWSISSQSVADNKSTVSWKMQLISDDYGKISSTASKDWSVTVNGTKYSGTNTIGMSANSTKTLASGTTSIAHSSDGTKTFSYSFSQELAITFNGSYVGTKSGSGSGTLTTIPRKSTMSVGNGTLGTAQTLTVSRKSSSFTHTITATCGSASSTISTKSTSTSISFTPPISWASQNTTGTSVSVKYTITTYNGSTSIGSNSYTVTCSIPSSVKPSVSMTVSDPTGYLSTYGGYVQGLSKFTVSLSAAGLYSSTIKSYKTTANGGTYTASSFTTGVITSSGILSIATTVTDSRSRTATASKSVTVLAYATPKISAFTVARCNQDGTANSGGSYMKVTFSSSVTALNNKNKATYTLKYKKSTDSAYTSVTLSSYANNYAVSGGSYIFAADVASSYNVTLTLADNFKSVSSSGTGSTATKTMSLYKQGKGVAVGKIAEEANVLDSAWAIKEQGSFLSKKYSKHVDLYGSNVQNDYCYTVIGVCNTGGTNASPDSYTIGQFCFHRNNGLSGAAIVDVAIEAQYAGANAINAKVNQYGYSKLTVEPCTFTYNGVVYGGLKVFFDAAALKHVEFNGSSNFNIFALDYYNTQTGVINSEIYNSIKVASNSGNNYLGGNLVVYGADNWFGRHRFNAEWIGMYNAYGGTRKGWIGHDGSNHLMIRNEAGGNIELYTTNSLTFGSSKGIVTTINDVGTMTMGNSGTVSNALATYWKDSSVHHLVSKDADGLSAYLGWAGSSSYATVTTIRGRTCKYANSSGTTTLSDRNLKKDFEDFTDVHDVFFDNLKPLTYKYKMGSSGRPHFGYITQEVEEALEKAGLTTKDFAGVNIMPINCRETEEDAEGNVIDVEDSADNYLLDKGIKEQHNLVYTEFISMNTWQIQKLKKRVNVLESKVDVLEEKSVKQDKKINKLEDEVQRLKELVEQLVS